MTEPSIPSPVTVGLLPLVEDPSAAAAEAASRAAAGKGASRELLEALDLADVHAAGHPWQTLVVVSGPQAIVVTSEDDLERRGDLSAMTGPDATVQRLADLA